MVRPTTSHRECLRPEDQETDMRPHWGHTSSTRMLTQAHVPNLPSSDGAGSTSLSLEGCCRHWSHCDLRVRSGHQRRASAQDRASPSVRIGLAIGTCGSPALSLNMDGQQSNRSHSRSSTDGTSSAMSHNPRSVQPRRTWGSQGHPAFRHLAFSPSRGATHHPRGWVLGGRCQHSV